jgi:hypothetical protein
MKRGNKKMKRNRPMRNSQGEKGKKDPYAFNRNQMRKQFPTAPAFYSPTLAVPVTVLLNPVPTGNSDNTRLSDKIIVSNVEVLGVLYQVSTGSVITHSNLCSRMLICASVDGTLTNPLTGNSPLSTIDNTIVPDRVEIFYDSGPWLTTPSLTGLTPNEIFRRTYNIKQNVRTNRPIHITREKKKYSGVETTYLSGGVTVQNGAVYALFLCDDAAANDGIFFNVAFQVEFSDLVVGFEASANARINLLEARLARQSSLKEVARQLLVGTAIDCSH